jgi:hypothetical protein
VECGRKGRSGERKEKREDSKINGKRRDEGRSEEQWKEKRCKKISEREEMWEVWKLGGERRDGKKGRSIEREEMREDRKISGDRKEAGGWENQ